MYLVRVVSSHFGTVCHKTRNSIMGDTFKGLNTFRLEHDGYMPKKDIERLCNTRLVDFFKGISIEIHSCKIDGRLRENKGYSYFTWLHLFDKARECGLI